MIIRALISCMLLLYNNNHGAVTVTSSLPNSWWSEGIASPHEPVRARHSLLWISLQNLQSSFRFIRPADTKQWFMGPAGLWPSTAFLYLAVFLSFVGPLLPLYPSPHSLHSFVSIRQFITFFRCLSSPSSLTVCLFSFLPCRAVGEILVPYLTWWKNRDIWYMYMFIYILLSHDIIRSFLLVSRCRT